MSDEFRNIYIVLHNVHAVSKVLETAQVVYGFGIHNFVISKAAGSAAQTGVPDANKMALKMKRNFMVLSDLPDVLELLDVKTPFLLVSPKLTKNRLDLPHMAEIARSGERLVIVVSGSTSSFSRKEMDLGECISLPTNFDIGPAGTVAVLLYAITNVNESK